MDPPPAAAAGPGRPTINTPGPEGLKTLLGLPLASLRLDPGVDGDGVSGVFGETKTPGKVGLAGPNPLNLTPPNKLNLTNEFHSLLQQF